MNAAPETARARDNKPARVLALRNLPLESTQNGPLLASHTRGYAGLTWNWPILFCCHVANYLPHRFVAILRAAPATFQTSKSCESLVLCSLLSMFFTVLMLRSSFTKGVVEIHVLPTRALFGADILRR